MDVLKRAEEWATNELFDEEFRSEIKELINNKNHKEITERFYKDLEFGTGGMRSILGAGPNRINRYTIRRASFAVSLAVKKVSPNPSIAVSYDSRRMSFELATEAAATFAANGVKAYLFETLNPVALLSFSTRYHQAEAGVMVTASHNPPEYNGFKVFWSDGAQVTPPHDQEIVSLYNNNEDFSKIPFMDFDQAIAEGKIVKVGKDVEDAYHQAIKECCLQPDLIKENSEELKIVYTPIHGTGLEPVSRVLREWGFANVHIVKEQAEPNGNFPTVSSPNPENPEALELAVALMKEKNADIVFGSDPDTDRLGVAIPHEGEVVYLNGNQIGLLLLNYILEQKQRLKSLPINPYFVKTIVTSPLQEIVAKHFGVNCYDTLTGFKWICGLVNKLKTTDPDQNFVFGTEESFGYLNHSHIRDKDGVAPLATMAELALHYKKKNMNLIDALDEIYEQHGFSHESLLSLTYPGKEGAEKIARIMEWFRREAKTNLFGHEVDYYDDIKEGKRFRKQKTDDLDLPTSNVLGYYFTDGNRLWLRPSGTEPKIKFYIQIQETEGSLNDKKKRAYEKTDQLLSKIKEISDSI